MNRRRGRIGVTTIGLALVGLLAASSAQAALSGALAPIGSASSGNYLVTIKNEGPKTEGSVLIELGGDEEVSAIAPSACAYDQPVAGAIGCRALAAGATLQVCYHGPAASGLVVFYAGTQSIPLSKGGAVGSCPIPGFRPPTGGSGGFSLGKAKDNPKIGTATLPVVVPGAGAVRLSGPGVKPASASAKAAATVHLTVEASGRQATKLAQSGAVTLQVSVTFTATGGKPSTESTTVKLIYAAPNRSRIAARKSPSAVARRVASICSASAPAS
jgi:hypothetical protein